MPANPPPAQLLPVDIDAASACNRDAPGYREYVERLKTEPDPFADKPSLIERLEEKAAFLNAGCDCGTCQQCIDGLMMCEAANELHRLAHSPGRGEVLPVVQAPEEHARKVLASFGIIGSKHLPTIVQAMLVFHLQRKAFAPDPAHSPERGELASLVEALAVAERHAAKWRKKASKHTRKDGRRSDYEQADLARAKICDAIAHDIKALHALSASPALKSQEQSA